MNNEKLKHFDINNSITFNIFLVLGTLIYNGEII